MPLPVGTEYISKHPWNANRPDVLVIACSDGRIQANIDDFLENHLGITAYDRLYLPGGPGGLAGGGAEYLRAAQMVAECTFLLRSHGSSDVILIFHGATEDGPEEAICADYRRKHPGWFNRVPEIQDTDLKQIMSAAFKSAGSPRVRAYRADVNKNLHVRFSPMSLSG
jgi:hypothetical protein